MSYFPIQTISTYSLLKSPMKPSVLISRAKELGYTSLALTDYDVLYGAVDFYNAAKKAKVKPILGLTLMINGFINKNTLTPIILLAKNNQGYKNLLKISSYKMTLKDQKQSNILDIKSYLKDLIVISPIQGEINKLILHQAKDVESCINLMKQLVDKDSFYVGININQSDVQINELIKLSEDFKFNLVVDEKVEYLNPEDEFSTKVLQAIDANIVLTNLGRDKNKTGNFYLKNIESIKNSYQNTKLYKAYLNNENISQKINVDLEFKEVELPNYPLPENVDSKNYLAKLAKEGLISHNLNNNEYLIRLKKELQVINDLGFNDYFLIVWDVIKWAHKHNIQTGPGRGSVAGSLVAYALMITDVDPIEYDLLFERFLNPSRAQMPDIDLDLPDDKRELVLEYVHEKYGHEHVAQIITFGTLSAKQVIRDVARVFGYSQLQLSHLAKALPNVPHVTLNEIVNSNSKLIDVLKTLPNGELLLTTAKKIEGLPRNYSTHAAGIVISRKKLTDVIPVQNGVEHRLMTQFSKNAVESLGLLKMDFLGLRNLSLLANIVENIKKSDVHFSLKNIKIDDEKTVNLFKNGKTNGIFQFESPGIKKVLKQLRPDSFELIAAVNALYRPGPMENISTFIARKEGKEVTTYPDEVLRPILNSTFGIIVYQEQVMKVASALAGFTLAQADMLRRAISKKNSNEISILRDKFINGAINLGHSKEVAKKVYDYIESFANYGFNRSHAIAYTKMAFQLAYLKVHYPKEFFVSLINSNMGNNDKIKTYVQELKEYKIPVIGPNINQSKKDFSINYGALQFGLGTIKGLRSDFVKDIIELREDKVFDGIINFINRINNKWRKEELLVPLIQVGAFDGLGYNRRELTKSLNGVLEAIGILGESMSLFSTMAPKIVQENDFSLKEKLDMEVKYLGMYVSAHPVEQYTKKLMNLNLTSLSDLVVNTKVNVIGLLINIKVIRTKNGKKMAFLNISDNTGEKSVTLFPNTYLKFADILKVHQIYVFNGYVEQKKEIQLVGENLNFAENELQINHDSINKKLEGTWFLRIKKDKSKDKIERELKQLVEQDNTVYPVILIYEADNKKILLSKPWGMKKNKKTLVSLTSLLGRENVIFKEK